MHKISGVFSKADFERLICSRRIKTLKGFKEDHLNPASLDITTTGEVFRINRLLQPSQLENETVRSLLSKMEADQVHVGSVMEVGATYLAKASIDINFPPGMYGYLNAKSSCGRNFLFVRSLADGIHEFDSVDRRNHGYTGELWLVIQPLAFPVILSDKECYNQLRVFDADTRFSKTDLEQLLCERDILYRRNQEPYKQGELSLFTNDGSVLCTLDALPKKHVGYKAKSTNVPIDLTKRKSLNPHDFFDPVIAESFGEGKYDGFVHVEAGHHYLLATNEMLKISVDYTAELTALDPRLGFFFTHFAGFFDPGFFGTGTLEVFAPHNTFLRHKQPLARFVFEKMKNKAPSYADNGNYSGQIETQLPKQFADW
ncbi:MAG: 2'-deoxycytidine 5'-triphosphate deaminase [Candidatus Pacebacteria bacterium]|nr:2'-deoxycytidine 5'-triphosphate deaminase [Candidatus Paceibacterota bacterium]MBP9866774.1 2'-deoxycytidine 5'-triphosphate deaminase [Candidatus Paceibacterota bacterium]